MSQNNKNGIREKRRKRKNFNSNNKRKKMSIKAIKKK